MEIGNNLLKSNFIDYNTMKFTKPTDVQPQAHQPGTYMPKFPTGIGKDLVDQMKNVYDEKMLKGAGAVECSTCAARKYQDGSNDPGVSFKTPTHISPEQSGAAVMSHEQEHVASEQAKAKQDGGEIISQSVSIFVSTCPECGRSYTSGGLTKTTVRYGKNENENAFKGQLLDLKL